MSTIYRIDDLTLDSGRQQLRRGTETIRLGPLTYRVLLALIDAAPNVVSHNQLADTVWCGRAVSQETISQRVKLLRYALGDDAHDPRYVEMLRGRGYRLIPGVAATEASGKAAKSLGSRAFAVGTVLAVALAIIATILLVVLTSSSTRGVDERAGGMAAPVERAPPEYSIAVLPFDNLSSDPEQEYFVEGMHEAVISELARIERLTVISKTSVQRYNKTTRSLSQIARALNVAMIVEGSVLMSANQLRIQIRLIGVEPERHLLAQTYDRELSSVLELQSNITRDIAKKINVRLTAREESRLAESRAVESEAYVLWLKGNYQLSKLDEESMKSALAYYQRAVDRDPRYAAAYAGLAMAYMQLGSWNASRPPEAVTGPARTAAEQALALDPTLAEAHLALGYISAQSDWDWDAADRAFRQGVALGPSNTLARIAYANFLTAMGRFEESIEYGERTLQLNPVSSGAHGELAFAYWLSGQENEALRLYREGLEFEPDSLGGHGLIAELYLTRGDVDEALPHLARFDGAVDTLSPPRIGVLGRLYAMAGREQEARALLSDLRARRARTFIPAVPFAYIHLGLGETEEALKWLEVAYEERDVSLIWLKVLPAYDSVRSSPRFQAILDRMNFPPDL